MNQLSKTQKRVIWHMANSWMLVGNGTGTVWLEQAGSKNKPVRTATKDVLLMVGYIRIVSWGKTCIQYDLYPAGAELAKTIQESDFT